MVAKMILPSFGGSPQVWSASMVFFQASLLLGYLYAHLSVRWLGERRQSLVHVALLILGALALPISAAAAYTQIASGSLAGAIPSVQVLATLTLAVAAPFTLLAAGAPLLQKWLAATDDPTARD